MSGTAAGLAKTCFFGSNLLGAAYLLMADALARKLFSMDVPVGIFAGLLGAPTFLLVLRQIRGAWV
ncbi:iron chelate uptake ABC transporter family permease subunit [Acidithiobacillus sp.]|uniref:iron chelate uptake ABC transporter family permease subunit n=1 Tax=Acidithiobacillus sp. TaxID=1872118 RepID=UPI0025C38F48|nr:iron chelate uptake ABC transporter family permease subunit [Acidithiobacillus sp.]